MPNKAGKSSCKPERKKKNQAEGVQSRNCRVKEIFPQQNRDLIIQESEKNNLSMPLLSRKQPAIEAIHLKDHKITFLF